MVPLELALLVQLVQGDKKLNRDIKSLCSSFCKTLNTVSNGTCTDASVDLVPLQNAVTAFKDLSRWVTEQNPNTLLTEDVGKQLIQKCRQLGLLETPFLESSSEPSPKPPVKIFCDGVFDLMHAGIPSLVDRFILRI